MELVLSGQFDWAKRRAELMGAAFPGEPVTPLALALIATLEEDVADRQMHVTRLEQVVGDPARMGGFRAALHALDLTIAANHALHGPKGKRGSFGLPANLGVEQMVAAPRRWNSCGRGPIRCGRKVPRTSSGSECR